MRLSLLRHGMALPSSYAGDFGRELTLQGQAEAQAAARALKTLPAPDRILCSPAVRTRQTAEQVCSTLGLPADHLQAEPELYLASVDGLLQVITENPVPTHLLVIGHNPGLSELVARLSPQHAAGELATGQWWTVDGLDPVFLKNT